MQAERTERKSAVLCDTGTWGWWLVPPSPTVGRACDEVYGGNPSYVVGFGWLLTKQCRQHRSPGLFAADLFCRAGWQGFLTLFPHWRLPERVVSACSPALSMGRVRRVNDQILKPNTKVVCTFWYGHFWIPSCLHILEKKLYKISKFYFGHSCEDCAALHNILYAQHLFRTVAQIPSFNAAVLSDW